MSSKNPSTMLAESLADFSKAAYQVFTEVETKARQDVAHAVAEAREAREARDTAMMDLRILQLESESWKEDAASSKAAVTQAELTIAQQAENLLNQLETITQLRREVNQWKDQARNWQEHFLRVEEERCAQFSRIDEFIIQKLERFQYAARPGTSGNAFATPKTSKTLNQINSAPSSITMKPPASPRPTHPPAYRPNADSATPEEPLTNGTIVQASNSANSANMNLTPESGSRRTKPKAQTLQHYGRREGAAALPGATEKPPNGRKRRESISDNHATETTLAQSHSHQQTLPSQSIKPNTVIRRVQAVITVKHEEDDADESGETGRPSPPPAPDMHVMKRRNEEPQGNVRRLSSRRGTALVSDNEENEVGSEEENKGTEGGAYKFRRTSRINYREEDDNEDEEDELMMGGEDNRDELHGAYPSDQSRQQAVSAPSRKKRKYSLR